MAGNGNARNADFKVRVAALELDVEIATMALRAKTVPECIRLGALQVLFDNPGLVYSVRQMFYQLVARFALYNNQNSYKAVSDALARGREDGLIEWNRFEDRIRQIIDRDKSADEQADYTDFVWLTKHYIRKLLQIQAHADYWERHDFIAVAGIEKASLGHVIESVAEQCHTLGAAFSGFGSVSQLKSLVDAADRLNPGRSKKFLVVYAGDFDPEGMSIPIKACEWLERHSGRTVELVRVALSQEQALAEGYPPQRVKRSSPLSTDWIAEQGEDCWEVDAIPGQDLIQMYINAFGARHDMSVAAECAEKARHRTAFLRRGARGMARTGIEELREFLTDGSVESYIEEIIERMDNE